ncbi:MAG: NusG domain II-containing protein [Treponema sp.]|nr:NusG domain II-containing protein [Treponema sp.]
MIRIKIKFLDIIIIIISIAITVFSFIKIKNNSKSSKPMLIITAEKTNYIYPMDKDAIYKVEGLMGTSIIQVKDGKAFFVDSPCPNKNCVHAGHISCNGEWNACLPNSIFIRIQQDQSEIDASAF